jgi:CRISPR/Cas system CSM-associated protein Csm4 (group 5 of RAMP superfamily)
MQNNEQDKTITKTLWSETIIDALIVGLQKKAPDEKIKELVKEIKDKGFKSSYIIEKVTKELGPPAAVRIRQLLGK